MIRRIIRSGLSRLGRRLSASVEHERANLAGREVVVTRGIRWSIPDYDDAWFLACARHCRTLYDVGANVGFNTLVALALGSARESVLIEPNPEALVLAADNLIRNGYGAQARFVLAFASASSGRRVTLWTSGSGAAGSVYASHARTASIRGESLEVSTRSLDSVIAELGIIPDLVKIDVEGAESDVLAGSAELAAGARARFLVEMHSNPELSMSENAERILAWCSEWGYNTWYLKQHERLTDPRQVALRGRCHLLIQPRAWDYPEWLADIEQSASLEKALAATVSLPAREGTP